LSGEHVSGSFNLHQIRIEDACGQGVLMVLKFAHVSTLSMPRRAGVREWIEISTNCQKGITDFERSGQPSTSATDEKQEEAKAIILYDRRVTTEEIALKLVK
jgi:hypothetical protein